MKRRFLGIMAMLVVLCCAVTVSVFGADPVSGSYGDLTWTYQDGTLTIFGTGHAGDDVPWSSYKSEIRNLVMEDGVRGLGQNAMMDCTALESVAVPDSVQYFGNQCFSGCVNLKSITLPERFTGIGVRTFKGSGLESVEIPGTVEVINSGAFSDCGELKSVTFHEGLNIIWEGAFSGCTALESVELPDSLKYTQERIFYGCTSLKYVKYSASVTDINTRVFYGCSSLETVEMPNSCTSVMESAFGGCKSLKSFDLSDASVIKNDAFNRCESLEEVTLSDELETLENYVFSGCTSLKTVRFGNGVKTIKDRAFSGCSALEEIELPPSLDIVNDRAFADCTSLKTVVVNPMLLIIKSTAFGYGGSPSKKLDQDITFYGYQGSTTEEYASAEGFDFVKLNPEDAMPFRDVAGGKYYAIPALWASQRGVTSGVAPDRFAPESSCTRAQVVTFLWRLSGCPNPGYVPNDYQDLVPGSYYYTAVMWAKKKGICYGTTWMTFSPDQPVTRGEFVTFLYRMSNAYHMSDANGKEAFPFADVAADSYYYNAIAWAYGNGITSGVDATHFAPNQRCTRGQVVTFIYRFCGESNYHMRTPSWTD